jgi:NAD(P)H-hydrate epimerase
MGLSIQDPEALKLLVKSLLDRDVRLSLDATALVNYILPFLSGKNVVVTPHAGEFKKMFGEILPESKKARIIMVEKFAKEHSVTILLKGPTDIISNGTKTYINPTNTPGMTVGGTGDILSGIIAGMLARNRNALESAVISAYFNGIAGKMTQKKLGHHMTATDLLDALPSAMKSFDKIK